MEPTYKTLVKKSYSSSIALFDEFTNGDKTNNIVYKRLLLKNVYLIRYDNYIYRVNLKIERATPSESKNDNCISFTEFREGFGYRSNTLIDYETCNGLYLVHKLLAYFGKRQKSGNDSEKGSCLFTKPYCFRAQNSRNRSGYGNVVIHGEIVHQGTLYGATDDYLVVGFSYTREIAPPIKK